MEAASAPMALTPNPLMAARDSREKTFSNPATQTTYRLRFTSATTWRLTKARQAKDNVILRHLHGDLSPAPLPLASLHALVAGRKNLPPVTGDPVASFPVLVLHDLISTYHLLVAIASEASDRYEKGSPGYRPRSPLLKQAARDSIVVAEENCRAMAKAWDESGLVGLRPEWMVAALGR